MHGSAGEERSRRRRGMWPVHDQRTADGVEKPELSIGQASSEHSGSDFFVKDGRKIRVGDCALFQSGNAPPFIGIIRWFSSNKEHYLKLSVNWLYRPSDVKLSKGVLLDAAPNEVFYSFHKDEISAESLLHPCKVAFLRKGVELPSGISSFVCRRVYDIANKCLWWLTDQDYINEHQEEVDQLLDKTQLEMHAAVQSGGRSPKQLNGPSAQQLKSGSDNVQNGGSSVPSHGKGRKREKAEHSFDSVKRDRASKPEDADSGNARSDSIIKAEIAKITDRGGLIDTDGVEKLLNIMQSDRGEKKMDSAARVLLADVIASTDRFECLVRFVQLKGVLVLDDWLQEAHKGKIGDGSSPRESDKSVEELLLALLRALDKLPVNLHALQTSNIGKSVNNLRQHKNSEIQKKARHLVDTWKKRVDAEMTKSALASGQSVSWSGKPSSTDNSHAVGRRTATSDIALKGPNTQTTVSKSLTVKSGHIDAGKPSPVSSGASKVVSSVTIAAKDAVCKPTAPNGPSDAQLAAIKEEKSSGSSQSQNNSQSCSSDYAKNGSSSWREDARSSTAGSTSCGKGSGSASRHRKSNNGYLGTVAPGTPKDASMGKLASHQSRGISFDKVSPPGAQTERMPDASAVDGSSQRLIVRLPNPGRSPARCTTSLSTEDPSIVSSRASSPVSSEKHDRNDRKIKAKEGNNRPDHSADVNADALNTTCKKAVAPGTANLSPGSLDDEHRNVEDNGDVENAPKPSSSHDNDKDHASTGHKVRSSHDLSVAPINASSDSCMQYTEAAGDVLGMNLLASVATGEIPKSESPSPISPVRSSSTHDHSTAGVGVKLESPDDVSAAEPIRHDDRKAMEGERHDSIASALAVVETKLVSPQMLPDAPGDVKKSVSQTHKSGDNDDIKVKLEVKASEAAGDAQEPNVISPDVEKTCMKVDRSNPIPGKRMANGIDENAIKKPTMQSPSKENKPSNFADGKFVHVNISTLDGDSLFSGAAKIQERKAVEESIASCNVNVDKIDKMNEESGDSVPIVNHMVPTAGTKENLKGKAKISLPKANNLDQDKEVASVEVELQASRPKAEEKGELVSSDRTIPCPQPGGSDASAKCVFDLNEGISSDEGNAGEASTGTFLRFSACRMPPFLSFTVSPLPASSVPITVAASAKRPFVPPENPLKNIIEPGWKGSAATSAFRPAEPRKALEMTLNTSEASSDSSAMKQSRPPLEFDLNVPDERVVNDITSHRSAIDARARYTFDGGRDSQGRNGGLDLDLNRVDEDSDCGSLSASTSRRAEVHNLLGTASGVFPNADTTSSKGFDLNDGPGLDEINLEPASRNQHPRNNAASFITPVGSLRMSGSELGNFPWFPPGNSYPAVAIPPYLPDRGDHPYPIVAAPGAPRNLVPSTVGGSFGNDIYRGPVLASSPAMAFSPYTSFPFGSSFPLPSTTFSGVSAAYADSSSVGGACFPAVPSQFTGPATVAASAFPRSIMISIPENSAGGVAPENRKWGRQSLDLNAGPMGVDPEGRDERLSAASRQHFVASSQPFTEDPARIFQMVGAGLKRKEPEGGWDSDRFTYKQPSRQ